MGQEIKLKLKHVKKQEKYLKILSGRARSLEIIRIKIWDVVRDPIQALIGCLKMLMKLYY